MPSTRSETTSVTRSYGPLELSVRLPILSKYPSASSGFTNHFLSELKAFS